MELHGRCYSARTFFTAYVEMENLCIAPGAFMAFHAVRAGMDGPIMSDATLAMVQSFPPEIHRWIDANGGYQNCRATATGQCMIASFGQWVIRGASDPDRGRAPKAVELVPAINSAGDSRANIEPSSNLRNYLPKSEMRRTALALAALLGKRR